MVMFEGFLQLFNSQSFCHPPQKSHWLKCGQLVLKDRKEGCCRLVIDSLLWRRGDLCMTKQFTVIVTEPSDNDNGFFYFCDSAELRDFRRSGHIFL